MTIEWRPVPSLDGVFAGSDGSLKKSAFLQSQPKGGFREIPERVTKGVRNNRGYHHTKYKCAIVSVHRAVCEAFHGPQPFPGALVMHLNDDTSDNRPENLRWGTAKENSNAPRRRFLMSGERNPNFRGGRKRTVAGSDTGHTLCLYVPQGGV